MLSFWSKSIAPCACHSVFEYNWAMEVWSNNWALCHHPWLISSRFLVCYSIIIVSIYDSYDSLGFFQICMGLVLLNQCDFDQDLRIIQSPKKWVAFSIPWADRQDLASEPEPEEDNNLAVTIFGKEYEGRSMARTIDMRFLWSRILPRLHSFCVCVCFFLWGLFDVFLAFGRKSGLFC